MSSITGSAEIQVLIMTALISSNNYVIKIHYSFRIDSVFIVVFLQSGNRPFRTLAVLLDFRIFDILFGMLVDAKICQMDISLFDIF